MYRYTFLFFVFIQMIAATAHAHNCSQYKLLMDNADAYWKQSEFEKALNQLAAAREHCPAKGAEVDKKLVAFMADIANKYREAEAEKIRADQKAVEARNAERLAEKERQKAVAEKEKAIAAEQKALAVLDKIYFYQDRFGLAYDKNEKRYGFIDKNLNTKIGYKYDEALPFDYSGFTKVKRDTQYFFVDTLGSEYPLTSDLHKLTKTITALDLRQKGLRELPDTLLKSIQLEVLFLAYNQLDSLPSQIGNLKNLQSFFLASNQLVYLPPQIGKLENLKFLELDNNKLTSLPPQIGALKNIQELYLYSNQLTSLPAQIGELKNLKSLNLSGNQLSSLPEQIGELKNLKSLDLNSNQLKSLPVQIGALEKLTELNLGSYSWSTYKNQLATLPTQIWQLKNLQSLSLSGNQLTSLSEQIGELKKLQSLNLSRNQITNLPKQIGALKNLKSLIIRENQLTNLPEQIGALKNLQSLNLTGNQIKDLPEQIWGLKNLQKLNLSKNQLASLCIKIAELKNLQSLDLSMNQLTNLPQQIIELNNLTLLDLTGNRISHEDLEYLQKMMPWCTIIPLNLFHQNEEKRRNWELLVADGEGKIKSGITDTSSQKNLANAYNFLAWYQLQTRQFASAEASLARSFQLDSTNIYTPTNLASALLFQGKTELAMQEYQKWKNLPFGPYNLTFYRDAFLADFLDFEKTGIIPEARKADVAAVRKMLGE